ncbi:visual pigment-like receptor peropsin [Lytechinus variegatus]|uniref:visual pigment-like receptor peropsin n=1 Tax=Lytechinus variegatus TaxID=7654 RepID=UPI001BB17780|nr:visual pigment-like receptor peropsin [Lytechinus variegatus]
MDSILEIGPEAEQLHYAVGTILIVWWAGGVFGNATLFAVFARYRQLCSPVNVLLLSLGLANLGMTACCIPLSTTSNFIQIWIFRWEGCKFYGFFFMFFGLSVIGNTVILAVSRYLIVCRGELAQQLTFSHYRYFAMSAWVNGLFWAVMPIFGWSRYDIEAPLQTTCFVDWQRTDLSYVSYIISWFVVNFVLPLSLMVFAYVSAFLMRQEGQFADPIRNNEPLPSNVDWASQPEAHWVGIATVVVFVLSWLPYSVVFLHAIAENIGDMPPNLPIIAPLFAEITLWIHPILFLVFIKKFRSYAAMMICCRTEVEEIEINPQADNSHRTSETRRFADHFV